MIDARERLESYSFGVQVCKRITLLGDVMYTCPILLTNPWHGLILFVITLLQLEHFRPQVCLVVKYCTILMFLQEYPDSFVKFFFYLDVCLLSIFHLISLRLLATSNNLHKLIKHENMYYQIEMGAQNIVTSLSESDCYDYLNKFGTTLFKSEMPNGNIVLVITDEMPQECKRRFLKFIQEYYMNFVGLMCHQDIEQCFPKQEMKSLRNIEQDQEVGEEDGEEGKDERDEEKEIKCLICHEIIGDDVNVRKLNCECSSNIYCAECIDPWFLKNGIERCPHCQKALDLTHNHEIKTFHVKC